MYGMINIYEINNGEKLSNSLEFRSVRKKMRITVTPFFQTCPKIIFNNFLEGGGG